MPPKKTAPSPPPAAFSLRLADQLRQAAQRCADSTGYPLTAWSALLLPTTSPAAAIACTANDHGQKEREKADRRRDRTPPEDRPTRPKTALPRRPPDSYRITTRQPPAPAGFRPHRPCRGGLKRGAGGERGEASRLPSKATWP